MWHAETSLMLPTIGVLEEAEFYNITDLIQAVKERIAERDAKQNQVSYSPVFKKKKKRVLYCL